ncbi:hypothetical protein [Streptomyces sp. NPDC047108]|uniref:hypothetical protein n=1 Tax=Streptomyces sp. NPDC047108 TaxID=3155025 RepID=UPI0033F7D2D5
MSGGCDRRQVIAMLREHPERYASEPAEPHPGAAALVLPNGAPAPDCLREWAAFDNRFPMPGRRTGMPVAGTDGVLLVEPMETVLRRVCVDSVAEELDDEDVPGLGAYTEGLFAEYVEEFPGYGVVLVEEYPDPLLWIAPSGSVTLIWYERDEFWRRATFDQAVEGFRDF